MDNRKVIYKLSIACALAVSLVGCNKWVGDVDNNNVISKPYALFAADTNGVIYKTNDGLNYEIITSSSGFPVRAMATSGNNLLYIMKNVHYINDLGRGNNGNPTYGYPAGPPGYEKSIIINIPSWNNKIYLAGVGIKGGLVTNDSNGAPGFGGWSAPLNWRTVADVFLASSNAGAQIVSLTFLKEGALLAYDDTLKKIYRKPSLNDTFRAPEACAGVPITAHCFMNHIENTVLLADTKPGGKVYYSTDYGANFTAYTGLPADVEIMSMEAPFDQTILVGTRSHGIFKLPLGSTTFRRASLGLPSNVIVPSLASKYNHYKDDHSKQFVYAATNQGIYKSEDFGDNWVKVYGGPGDKGNFVCLY